MQPIELVEFEEHRPVWNHAQEAARLLQHWRIPDELVCCVLLHHRGLDVLSDRVLKDTSVAAVCVSALIPDTLLQVPNGLESLIQLNESWTEFDLFNIAARVDDQFEELSPSPGSRMTLQQRIEEQRSKMGTSFPSENIDQPQAGRESGHTADAALDVQQRG